MIQPEHGWTSLWRHFFHRERTSEELTDSMVKWQERWRWDFLKNNPPACYHALDWGAAYQFYPDPLREPTLIEARIQTERDLESVTAPAPDQGMLGEQLQTIQNLRHHFGPDLPIVQTIFSPIEIAHRLMTGRKQLLEHLRTSPTMLQNLLQKITDVFSEYSLKCLDAGADGIFFATKWAASPYMKWNEYERFGKPYEMQMLNTLRSRKAWIILHVCGEQTYLDRMLNYDVDVFSYDFFGKGVPDPETVTAQTGKFVLGGINADRLQADTAGVLKQMERYAKINLWMAGPSCVVPPQVGDAAIEKLQERLSSLPS